MNIHIHRRFLIWPLSLLLVVGVMFGLWILFRQPKTDIRTEQPGIENFSKGKVSVGTNNGTIEELKTASALTYESAARRTKSPDTNGVGIIWEQEGDAGSVTVEIRANNGSKWSNWVDIGDGEDQKDTAQSNKVHTGMLLTDKAKEVQYRFRVAADATGTSPTVKNPRISLIDSTRGPNPTKVNPIARLFGKTAKARAEGPRIYSRWEWGCPEAGDSPRWGPEYRVPDEAIVHHTAATANPNDSAAAIRAIWYQHANANDWGDIGYNYLVDVNGNIYQGRYYDQNHATVTNQDAVGGHTLNGHNYHSVGVATLGNFTNQGVNYSMLDGVARIIAWKALPYTWNPNNRTIGHRDAGSTNCPGNNLYANLGTIRALAGNYLDGLIKWKKFDYSFQGEGVNGSPGGSLSLRPGQTTTAYLDLKNEGTDTWTTSVKLGTSNPYDRPSGFRHSSWKSPNRVGTFAGKMVSGSLQAASTIAPGETARWQFTVGNVGVPDGTFKEYFQPVAEGYTWFVRPGGIHWLMTSIGDVYTYQWITQSYNVPTEPGQSQTLTLDAKNTGNVDWKSNGANPVRLGTYRPRDRTSTLNHSSWINSSRPSSFIGRVEGGGSVTATDTIAPGETARFSFTAKAPNHPFVGNEYFNLVAEGKTWMNDLGIYWPLSIPQNYHANITGQSVAPTIDKSDGGIGSLYFDYRNTGTYSWRKSDGIVRLAPNHPNDRTSQFAAFGLSGGQLPTNTANWLTANRVGTFAGQVNSGVLDTGDATIEPGQKGRFYVVLDGRNVDPGTYREYFRMVADGFSWLEDYGVYLDVTVQP
ncbi:N-acetylmuramoyl-L-alanine amidase [Patescibacteria group bacterium]|nr:N-acetylmuramoyl-L-alanine amidase [Patescibacteria group bacterium]